MAPAVIGSALANTPKLSHFFLTRGLAFVCVCVQEAAFDVLLVSRRGRLRVRRVRGGVLPGEWRGGVFIHKHLGGGREGSEEVKLQGWGRFEVVEKVDFDGDEGNGVEGDGDDEGVEVGEVRC